VTGTQIYEGMSDGTLGGFDSFQMEGALAQFAALQSSCERIKDTPLPRAYDFFTRVFVWVFISLLPFFLLRSICLQWLFSLLRDRASGCHSFLTDSTQMSFVAACGPRTHRAKQIEAT